MTIQIPSPTDIEARAVPADTATPLWDRLWVAEDPSISGVQPKDDAGEPAKTARS